MAGLVGVGRGSQLTDDRAPGLLPRSGSSVSFAGKHPDLTFSMLIDAGVSKMKRVPVRPPVVVRRTTV